MKTPLAKLAQVKLKAAVDSGKLPKPAACEQCGSRPYKRLHGHHEDYSKPLKVKWLCPLCHKDEHLKNPIRPSKKYFSYGVDVTENGKKTLHRFPSEEKLFRWLAEEKGFYYRYQTWPMRKDAKPVLDRIKAGEKIKYPVEI